MMFQPWFLLGVKYVHMLVYTWSMLGLVWDYFGFPRLDSISGLQFGVCYMYVRFYGWFMFGVCLGYVGFMVGFKVVHVWFIFGLCLVYVWLMFG